jgi:hypothetical protein
MKGHRGDLGVAGIKVSIISNSFMLHDVHNIFI